MKNMTDKILEDFNKFRELCLINSEDAIKTAEQLQNKSVNQIAFQLIVYGLEEIGKIFVGWYQLNSKEKWGKEHYNIPMDDHIKKLFWAIWGPSFSKEKITKEQIEEFRNMASDLHNKRLDVMYTELDDSIPANLKISDEELGNYLKMSRARLELAKIDGEVDTDISDEKQEEINWFFKCTNDIEKRKFIFGNESQEKLIELGDIKSWMDWLKEHFTKEEFELKELLEKELAKTNQQETDAIEPKWKIKLKINSKSHSLRAKILNEFSSKSPFIKFFKGSDNHTLIVEIILDKRVDIKELWHRGWHTSNLLVASLNIGSNGLFYWNIPRNNDKFYEQITDLENKKQLEAKLKTSLELDWSSKRMYFNHDEIGMTFLVFRYFSSLISSPEFEAVNHYMIALGMLAKNDMHLRIETQCFLNFFLAFKKAIMFNENPKEDFDIKELGFSLIGYIIKERTEYDKVIDIGIELEKNNGQIKTKCTLTEIIGIKQYAGLYFISLAAKKEFGDKAQIITDKSNKQKKGSS